MELVHEMKAPAVIWLFAMCCLSACVPFKCVDGSRCHTITFKKWVMLVVVYSVQNKDVISIANGAYRPLPPLKANLNLLKGA